MMTTRQKGNYYELKSKALLEKQGFSVERALAKVIWIGKRPISMHHDFFGLFDLIAINSRGFRLVQVKYQDKETHGWLAETRKGIAEFPSPSDTKELHIWKQKSIGKRKIAELSIEVF